ncbi:hypothetical protein DS885_03700 [Psychromonas sp. B3M02]|uniref:hypothetical protein n=1 Tax=Psychromonas sp. B3M02 TaxID=2267226 RepID=UPI000DEB7561|nr:hypothetical protein [Psychromonas sp. B3M02]RBW47340.1 hypothetical protein DS885_03700 [Psychromonas sp. B3M02]
MVTSTESLVALVLFIIFGSGWVLSLIGVVFYQRTRAGWAYIVVMIGFSTYIPIGLLGVLGLHSDRKERDEKAFLEWLAAKRAMTSNKVDN